MGTGHSQVGSAGSERGGSPRKDIPASVLKMQFQKGAECRGFPGPGTLAFWLGLEGWSKLAVGGEEGPGLDVNTTETP